MTTENTEKTKEIAPSSEAETPKSKTKLLALIAVIIALFTVFYMFDINSYVQAALAWIEQLGVWGPLIFILLYIAATVLFIPGAIITLAGGALFGVIWGSVYVSIGSVIGATAAFIIGRYFARDFISDKINKNEKFAAIDDAVGDQGWKIVLLTRLSPIFPFNLLNYSFGLTKVSLPHYFFASWIGMFPGTVMYVYVGSLAGELAALGAEGREKTTTEWLLYGVGLLATIVVTVFVTRIAKKALDEKVSS